MLQVWTYTLVSVVIVSLISLVGIILLAIKDALFRRMMLYLVSFSTGALFGDAFIHILPEVSRNYGFGMFTSVALLSGIGAFFILEKFVHWHHCHGQACEGHPHPVAYTNLVGDSVHNFIDGMIIAGSFIVSPKLGLATTLAVILHEIPTELGHFSIFVYAGFSKWKALFFNFLSALTAILGAVVTLVAGSHLQGLTVFILPFTAGGFIYLAGSDLIPELHKEHDPKKSLIQFIMMLAGVGLMLLLLVAG